MTPSGIAAIAKSTGGDEGAFRRMMDALPVAVYTTDETGRLTYFNPAAVELSGRIPEIGSDRWCVTWRILLPDGSVLPHDQCPMAVALSGGQAPAGLEVMAVRPDGTRRWMMPYPAVSRDAEGKITGGINVLVDITHRKIGELKATEQFRAIVETTPECVKIVASDGRVLFMNSPGLEMVEAASADEVVGKSVYDLVASEDRDRFREFNRRVCEGGKGSIEFHIVGFNGTRRLMESHAAPLHYEGSTVHLAITHDVTKRRQAERASVLLSAIVDSSDDAIISKNLDGVITSWNQAAERLFGYSPEEAIGQPVTILIPEDRLEEEIDIQARLRCGERVEHFETVRRRKDGTLFDVSLTISPVRDLRGIVIGASKIARDISRQKRAENELRHANQDLEQFAFSVSHDLHEPLRSIKAYSELLGERCSDKLDEEGRAFVGFVQTAADRMESLTNDLLDYVRIRNLNPSVEESGSAEALARALANLTGAIEESQATITHGALPAVAMDGTHLCQVFQNLAGNAIKYREASRVPVIHVSCRREGGHWIFSVSDNGIGIKPEYLDRIFGLFERLHPRSKYSGTGIGLAICQRIVHRYGGRIWAESKLGEGSTFFFTVPCPK